MLHPILNRISHKTNLLQIHVGPSYDRGFQVSVLSKLMSDQRAPLETISGFTRCDRYAIRVLFPGYREFAVLDAEHVTSLLVMKTLIVSSIRIGGVNVTVWLVRLPWSDYFGRRNVLGRPKSFFRFGRK